MPSIKSLERLQKLHNLIQQECTGSPYELAERMYISTRLVHLLIEQLKDFNAKIAYDRSRKTYVYRNSFDLNINISISITNDETTTEIIKENCSNQKRKIKRVENNLRSA